MRIGHKYHLNKLEHRFANDFSSPVFPILAEFYFKLSRFNKAKKVCTIGLKHNPNNTIGQYVLAKIYLLEDNYEGAEELLKNVINNDPLNFKALRLFINVKIVLKHNISTFNQFIKKAYNINPSDKKIKKLYNKFNIKAQEENKKVNIQRKKKAIIINEKLATKTMYAVLIKQKKYNEALELLKIMKKNKKNKSFVKNEHKKVLHLIK